MCETQFENVVVGLIIEFWVVLGELDMFGFFLLFVKNIDALCEIFLNELPKVKSIERKEGVLFRY